MKKLLATALFTSVIAIGTASAGNNTTDNFNSDDCTTNGMRLLICTLL